MDLPRVLRLVVAKEQELTERLRMAIDVGNDDTER